MKINADRWQHRLFSGMYVCVCVGVCASRVAFSRIPITVMKTYTQPWTVVVLLVYQTCRSVYHFPSGIRYDWLYRSTVKTTNRSVMLSIMPGTSLHRGSKLENAFVILTKSSSSSKSLGSM